MDVPIACSLAEGAAQTQLGEWRELMDSSVALAIRTLPTRLELRLRPDCNLSAVAGLAQREVTCCPFFTFSIDVTSGGFTLVIDVPQSGTGALDMLMTD